MSSSADNATILLTGATGYVGGKLLPLLEKGPRRVRCLARRPELLLPKVAEGTQVVAGDVMDAESLDPAMEGVHTAYYLVHSLGGVGDFAESDAKGARNFAAAAARHSVSRIVYLGGLGESGAGLSKHLRSRQEVGRILRESGVPTIEFRASIVIGAGSLSFEMVRALVERLPVMITPKWVSIPAQPIAINDVLAYLIEASQLPGADSRIYEIGGADIVSYGGIMRAYARARGLWRLLVPVPVLTPYLSSLWLGLVTPVYSRIGRVLVEGVKNPTLVQDRSALEEFAVRPVGIDQAIRDAIETEDREFELMSMSDLHERANPSAYWGGVRLGARVMDTRTVRIPTSPEQVFRVVCCIGGENGYFGANWLWLLRGLLDRMIGGVGMRQGRTCAAEPVVGDEIDWWRVEKVVPHRQLRLKAEMKLPGRAWLGFELTPEDEGTVLRQTAIFDPRGVIGLLYWYLVYPAHAIVFAGMLRGIAKACENPSLGQDSLK